MSEMDGSTAIDADEAADLSPTHIRTRAELNAWEQANIVIAAEWLIGTRRQALGETLIRELQLVEDAAYWFEHRTYSVDEAVMRLHHRLVKIHPFANGNGRHARLWADLLLRQNGRPPFDWKPGLDRDGSARRRYIAALRRADAGHFADLFSLFPRDR